MKSETSSPSTHPFLQDLHALVIEAERMISNSESDVAPEALAALRQRFAAAQERLGELYTGARTRVVAGAKCTDEAIRSHPYQSLAIAAGVGLLLGVIVGRRRA